LLSITHETALNLDTSKQLLALSRKEPNARKRMRLLAVSLFFEGENRAKIARRLNTARGSVNKWVSSYLDNGLEGLDNKPYTNLINYLVTLIQSLEHICLTLSGIEINVFHAFDTCSTISS